ncbi:hypothetical protein T4C_13217 [Trichinella pseudospiralis]|uniref:Uncharacterized protein n=1 Tax=Trichinella pseudospiralis TaxID=6337 RepID=A0A0V1GG98_TRIPS|nr:hypothetical protein T4C_13217 [Trichinella pseudospiralis]
MKINCNKRQVTLRLFQENFFHLSAADGRKTACVEVCKQLL